MSAHLVAIVAGRDTLSTIRMAPTTATIPVHHQRAVRTRAISRTTSWITTCRRHGAESNRFRTGTAPRVLLEGLVCRRFRLRSAASAIRRSAQCHLRQGATQAAWRRLLFAVSSLPQTTRATAAKSNVDADWPVVDAPHDFISSEHQTLSTTLLFSGRRNSATRRGPQDFVLPSGSGRPSHTFTLRASSTM